MESDGGVGIDDPEVGTVFKGGMLQSILSWYQNFGRLDCCMEVCQQMG